MCNVNDTIVCRGHHDLINTRTAEVGQLTLCDFRIVVSLEVLHT